MYVTKNQSHQKITVAQIHRTFMVFQIRYQSKIDLLCICNSLHIFNREKAYKRHLLFTTFTDRHNSLVVTRPRKVLDWASKWLEFISQDVLFLRRVPYTQFSRYVYKQNNFQLNSNISLPDKFMIVYWKLLLS